ACQIGERIVTFPGSSLPDITCHQRRVIPVFAPLTTRTAAMARLETLKAMPAVPTAAPDPATFDLLQYGITVKEIQRNLAPAKFYAEAIREDSECDLSDTGALIAYSGDKTGRSPKDKRIVEHAESKGDVWWGTVNIPIDFDTFQINLERAKDYFNTRKRLYVVDGFAGWDKQYQAKVRVICTRPYHALFMHNLLIRPTREELRVFGTPHAVIYNA